MDLKYIHDEARWPRLHSSFLFLSQLALLRRVAELVVHYMLDIIRFLCLTKTHSKAMLSEKRADLISRQVE